MFREATTTRSAASRFGDGDCKVIGFSSGMLWVCMDF